MNSSDYLRSCNVGSVRELHPAIAVNLSAANNGYNFGLKNKSINSHSFIASRKRALSSSPYSDAFDINSMIRFSPNSLAAAMGGPCAGPNVPNACYGHLSASNFSPIHSAMAPHLQQLQAHLLRVSAGLLHPLASAHQVAPPNMLPMEQKHLLNAKSDVTSVTPVKEEFNEKDTSGKSVSYRLLYLYILYLLPNPRPRNKPIKIKYCFFVTDGASEVWKYYCVTCSFKHLFFLSYFCGSL